MKRKPNFVTALLPIVFTLLILTFHIFVNNGAPHIPLMLGIMITALFGQYHGYKWNELQEEMVKNVAVSIPVMGIFFTVGMTISTWILCGTVPLFIKIGLLILSPISFLPVACVICAFISIMTGTSWGTVGTMGLALLSIGESMGIPLYYTSGAVISGAWFGDKLSPLSDTTNFTAAIVDVDLYAHIRNLLPSTIPAICIALILYSIIGIEYSSGYLESDKIIVMNELLDKMFTLNIFMLIPPIVIIITVIKRIPALVGIFLGVIAAGTVAIIIQDASFGEVLKVMMNGYDSTTGNVEVDQLLSKGGIMSMMWVISLIMIAMAFGGIIEKTGCLEAILFALLNKLNGRAQLMTAVLFSTIGFNFASNAFIAYTLPGRIFAPAFRGIGLSTTNVSRGLEDGATMSAPLIPWNSGGAFVANTLGVPTIIYAPFAFANWLSPIFNLIWAWTGFFVPKAGKDEIQRWIYSDETIFVNGHMTTASKFDLKSIFENNYVQDTS